VSTRGACQWHVALLGLDARYADDAGVSPSFYQWQGVYSDEVMATTVGSYKDRTLVAGPLEYCSAEYDQASRAYFLDIARRAPADLLTRGYASILRILDLPLYWWGGPSTGVDVDAFSWRGRILRYFTGSFTLAVLATVALIGATSRRLGVFVLLFVLYFGALPSIQFSNRHFFHLEFIGWWAIVFLLWYGLRWWRTRAERGGEPAHSRLLFRSAQFAAVALIVAALPLPVLRAYQDRQMATLTAGLLDAPRVAVDVSRQADGYVEVIADAAPADLMRTAYLDLRLDPTACGKAFRIGLRYDTRDPFYDFSGDVRFLPAGTLPERILVPVYRSFDGVSIAGAPASCLSRLDRVVLSAATPLLPVLTLPPDWRDRAWHHQLKPSRWVAPFRWLTRTDG
jgi:hypothetical protein